MRLESFIKINCTGVQLPPLPQNQLIKLNNKPHQKSHEEIK